MNQNEFQNEPEISDAEAGAIAGALMLLHKAFKKRPGLITLLKMFVYLERKNNVQDPNNLN